MLHVAARHLGNENVKQCISMSGANVNAMAYPSKLTPLMLAILHSASDIVDTLLGAGADPSIRADKTINAIDAKGVNAFYAAAAKYEPRIFASIFDEELTSRFQRFPGDSEPFQSPCGSVLHGAASRASSGFLELAGPTMLARLGLSMNDVDSLGRTPLHVLCSCAEASAEMATRALDSGANVNAVDASGNTALHYAILRSNGPVVDVLLERPELAWSSTTVSEAMLNSAAKMGSLVLVNRILHAGQRITTSQCLLNAAEGDYYDIVVYVSFLVR
jgi:ankyrin repeat protein